MHSDNIAVSLRRLTRSFREGEHERHVLRGIELDVHAGECLALLGRSGSGKSTLLNLVSGIDQPTSGEVIVNGTNLNGMSERGRTLFRRRHIGFVYQFFNLLPTLTVEENVLLPLELNGRRGTGEATALLDEVGLGDRRATYPDRLSAGEQQRVAIARALVHRPALVLADEPTGSLDAETSRRVLKLLERLVREAGTTLILVTHSKQVTRLAGRVLVLQDGKLTDQLNEVAW